MKVKKYLNISAAICSIVLAAILIIGSISIFSFLGSVETSDQAAVQLLTIVTALLVVFSVAVIAVSVMCIVKSESPKNGLKIALLSLMAVLAILEIAGSSIIWGIICLIPVGLEIASIVVQEPNTQTIVEAKQEPAPETKQEPVAETKQEPTAEEKAEESAPTSSTTSEEDK